MSIGLCKEDWFALLLRCGQLHLLRDIATIKIAKELHLTPHEFMHWYEGGLLGNAKPTN
jgi:hypothetical protein